jgi:hypothetical protein
MFAHLKVGPLAQLQPGHVLANVLPDQNRMLWKALPQEAQGICQANSLLIEQLLGQPGDDKALRFLTRSRAKGICSSRLSTPGR